MLYNIPGAKRKTGYVHNRLNKKHKPKVKYAIKHKIQKKQKSPAKQTRCLQ